MAPNNVILRKPEQKKQQTLDIENIPDPLLNEQTHISDQEIEEAERKFQEKKKKRVPKGTNQYQAAWLVESDDEMKVDEEGENEEEPTFDPEFVEKVEKERQNKNSEETDSSDSDLEHEPEELNQEDSKRLKRDLETQKKRMDERNQRSLKELEQEDAEFPDEMDTPLDPPARIRFAKYRGLKSFRTTPWDPNEMLPFDYAKIFKFQNFKKTHKRVTQVDGTFVDPGQWVSLVIRNVHDFGRYLLFSKSCSCYPTHCLYINTDGTAYQTKPFVVGGLLAYENKYSVLNFNLTRAPTTDESTPLRSKDPVTFHFNFRRYLARPIYSENSLRSDKFKYLRFFRSEKNVVATFYGPITFPPANCQVFRGEECIAIGNLKSVDPDRMVIKKVILSGIPFQTWGNNARIKGSPSSFSKLFVSHDPDLSCFPKNFRSVLQSRGCQIFQED